MSRTNLLLSVPALTLSLALGACSGEDDQDPSSEASTSQVADALQPARVKGGCTAEVEVTGDVTASWSGKATVRRGEGTPTVYTTEADGGTVAAYAAAEGFETTANFTGDAGTFTTEPEVADGLDLDAEGTGGTIDADLVGLDDQTAHLTATFTCDETGKGGKNRRGEQGGGG